MPHQWQCNPDLAGSLGSGGTLMNFHFWQALGAGLLDSNSCGSKLAIYSKNDMTILLHLTGLSSQNQIRVIPQNRGGEWEHVRGP